MTTYPWATRCPIFSWFEATFWIASLRFTSVQFNQEGRGSTLRGKNHARKTFDPTEVTLYDQGSFYLTCGKFEANFWSTLRRTKKSLTNELLHRSKTIRVLTQNLSFWQMIAYKKIFHCTKPVFDISQLLSRKKTAKVKFSSKPIP